MSDSLSMTDEQLRMIVRYFPKTSTYRAHARELLDARARLGLLPEMAEALRHFVYVQSSASGKWEKTYVAREKARALLARYDEAAT